MFHNKLTVTGVCLHNVSYVTRCSLTTRQVASLSDWLGEG
jgi:hypothetical protein